MPYPGAAEDSRFERAPAKLNLDLLVTGRRADGYHLLDSFVVFLDLADTLRVAPAPRLSLELGGEAAADLDVAEDNLVLRAARALQAAAGIKAGARLSLEKRIPVAAGLGGGSADAAATLRLLDRFWRPSLPPAALAEIGLALGADVPACLPARPARLLGVGDRLDPASLPPLDLVLVNPRRALATAAVFRGLGPVAASARPAGGFDLLASRNDLEPAALRLMPEIGALLDALAGEPGCAFARMSGSGPTCFGLFRDRVAAQAAAARLAARHAGWWVVACRSEGAP